MDNGGRRRSTVVLNGRYDHGGRVAACPSVHVLTVRGSAGDRTNYSPCPPGTVLEHDRTGTVYRWRRNRVFRESHDPTCDRRRRLCRHLCDTGTASSPGVVRGQSERKERRRRRFRWTKVRGGPKRTRAPIVLSSRDGRARLLPSRHGARRTRHSRRLRSCWPSQDGDDIGTAMEVGTRPSIASSRFTTMINSRRTRCRVLREDRREQFAPIAFYTELETSIAGCS